MACISLTFSIYSLPKHPAYYKSRFLAFPTGWLPGRPEHQNTTKQQHPLAQQQKRCTGCNENKAQHHCAEDTEIQYAVLVGILNAETGKNSHKYKDVVH